MSSSLLIPHPSRGFTLVELVIVLAATLVIGAVGASAYQTYTVRAEIAAAIALASPAVDNVTATFRRTGTPPIDEHAAGLEPIADLSTTAVESIGVANGRIEIRFGAATDAAIAGRTLSLTPFETATLHVVWVCGNQIPGVGLNPLGFAGGAQQAVQVLTTIEARYLPPTCR